jgi:hypothetical protein
LNAPDLEQPLVVFRANFLGPILLEFEVDTPNPHDIDGARECRKDHVKTQMLEVMDFAAV